MGVQRGPGGTRPSEEAPAGSPSRTAVAGEHTTPCARGTREKQRWGLGVLAKPELCEPRDQEPGDFPERARKEQ